MGYFEANVAFSVGKFLLLLAFTGFPFFVWGTVIPEYGVLLGVVLYIVYALILACALLIMLSPTGRHRKPKVKERTE